MKIQILTGLLFLANLTFAQVEVFNTWYFGQNAGLNFNTNPVSVLTDGLLSTIEGSASISDSNGDLLFYSDGTTVWDRSHDTMPNGTGLTGNFSTTQSALIVQLPGSTSMYYLFTVPAEGEGELSYSIVDLTLNGGLGDIVLDSKNTGMPNRAVISSEKITAIRHCNDTDWWIITHDLDNQVPTNKYRCWLLSASGISNTPVVSSAGTAFFVDNLFYNQGYGWMTASNDGTTIVTPGYGNGTVDIVDFDNSSGTVSNAKILSGLEKPYGTEFSLNDQLLYVTANDQLFQFDLSQSNAAEIQASKVILATDPNGELMRAMRMGPDGKIYVSTPWIPFLGIIDSPNTPGSGCNFNSMGIDISNGGASLSLLALGLPNNYKFFSNPCSTSGIEESFKADEPVYPNPADEIIYIHGNGDFSLYNSAGILIHSGFFKQEKNSFNVSALEEGMYFLNINNSGIQKISIRH